ncbi:BTAD domain-containing putative transcriptional regulator [Planotetraspora sp. GP83]|uniref:BTAD domain-containing putative transcriptional regulator n=1 Tax=Planotetraspora sp. GP83 TaxID=3156264 RepID=UPI003515DBA7
MSQRPTPPSRQAGRPEGSGWPQSAGPQPRPRGAGASPPRPPGPPRPVSLRSPAGSGGEQWRGRRPVRIPPKRTAGDVFAGLGALLALAGLMGGVPYALLRLAGPPLPKELLNADVFTSQVGPETIIAILVLLVWLAWFQLFLCVVVEVYAGLRRVGMPARVPLSGGTQALANRLVSAVLLLFTATAVAVPIARVGAPAPIRPQMAALSAPVDPAVERSPLHAREVKKVYVVQPPHGRHHESLWEIADKCLGDGRRYHEIYRLNQHKEQPDGSRLHMADLIRPGWVLDMPDDARNVHVVPVDEDRPTILEEHRGKPAELDGGTHFSGTADAPDAGDVLADPRPTTKPDPGKQDPGKPGIVLPPPAMPQHTVTATPAGQPSAQPSVQPSAQPTRPAVHPAGNPASRPGERGTGGGTHSADPAGKPPFADPEESAAGLDLVDYLAAATLASAGLLAVLGRRRREQLWRRAFGHRVARPRGDAANAEVAIRLGADAPGSRMLDIGLRLLGKLLAERGQRPPTVYAVHLSARGLDLWIQPPDEDAPEPWEACDGGQVWRLPAHEGRRIDEHALADAPAPYPGLVSLGTGEGGRVLIDLESAHGLISMTGAHTVAALSALAVELATNRWSDHMRITLVGFGDELAVLAPERIRTAGSLADVLPEFEERVRQADDVLTGRIHGRVADPAWTPHYLLSAIRPDEDEARRLAMLGKGMRTASGFVLAGDVPHATWTWEITEDGRARVDALGFEVEAHLLPRRHYNAVVNLFRTAQRSEGEPLTVSDPAERVSDEPPSIEVRILGPIEISPVNPLEEGRAALAHELVVYLATHRAGVHPVVLGGVLWPRGVQPAVRDATIARVAEWLGKDSEGRPHLLLDTSGRLRLGPEIRTDWQLFQELVRRAGEVADARRPGEAEAVLLDQALGLVRGPLLNGRPGNRYAWLAADSLEYDVTAWVADAAHALCEIRLAQDDPHAAVAAARAGLLLAADDEGLWRDLLRAAHATGDQARLRAVVDGLHRRAASHPYGGGMAPETESLIDELLPAWRRGESPHLRTSRLA